VYVSRKGRHKDRSHKKEERETAGELEQLDVQQESADVIEDTEAAQDENIYISDQEDEQRVFCVSVM